MLLHQMQCRGHLQRRDQRKDSAGRIKCANKSVQTKCCTSKQHVFTHTAHEHVHVLKFACHDFVRESHLVKVRYACAIKHAPFPHYAREAFHLSRMHITGPTQLCRGNYAMHAEPGTVAIPEKARTKGCAETVPCSTAWRHHCSAGSRWPPPPCGPCWRL